MCRLGKLEVGWGFLVLAVMALIVGAGPVLPMTVLAALCHEGGHLVGLRLAGARVEAVRLTAFGAEIRADTRYLPYGREILCTLAGPAVNLVLARLFARARGWYLPAGDNLFLGCFNLLPLPSLDGGRALYLGVSWLAGPGAADRVCRWVGLVCAGGLCAGTLYLAALHHTGLFLFIAALGALFPQLPLVKRRQTG